MANCFFCLQPSILLLDRRMQNSLPRNCGVINVEPCTKCEELMKQGIILITATEDSLADLGAQQHRHVQSGSKHPFIPNPLRTGGWFVVTEDACRRWFGDSPAGEFALRHRWCFMSHEAAVKLGLFERCNEVPEKEIQCGCKEGCGCSESAHD